jgi:hypothetical protein
VLTPQRRVTAPNYANYTAWKKVLKKLNKTPLACIAGIYPTIVMKKHSVESNYQIFVFWKKQQYNKNRSWMNFTTENP